MCDSSLKADEFLYLHLQLIKLAREDPRISGVVLRIDSPGGSALASDIMWHEIKQLSKEMPVVASMADVAASGMLSPSRK
jgi:protease-4